MYGVVVEKKANIPCLSKLAKTTPGQRDSSLFFCYPPLGRQRRVVLPRRQEGFVLSCPGYDYCTLTCLPTVQPHTPQNPKIPLLSLDKTPISEIQCDCIVGVLCEFFKL